MSKFYITKVLAKGSGKTDSFVELQPGLNLIQGRSNTGKTCIIKCIDFCFGGKNKPFDDSLGYTTIELSLHTPKGNIQITRSFGKNKVEVVTNVPGYDSCTYDLKFNPRKKEPAPLLGDLLLASIGIEDGQYIYKNKYFDTQKMSWRTILPLLLFSVTDIVKETSVIEPTQGTEKTAFLSSLLLLIYGKEFANIDPKTKKEIRIARKNAVEEYVNKKIVAISEKKKVLEEQLALFDGIDVEEKIQEIIDSIKTTEEKISTATSTSKEILGQILELQEQAAECNLLQERYATLRQYLSEYAVYDPGLLVIDTPLLGLDQGVSDVSPESMRASLYTYFTNHQDCGQVILLDNMKDVPAIDFESTGTNVITFTKGLEESLHFVLQASSSQPHKFLTVHCLAMRQSFPFG